LEGAIRAWDINCKAIQATEHFGLVPAIFRHDERAKEVMERSQGVSLGPVSRKELDELMDRAAAWESVESAKYAQTAAGTSGGASAGASGGASI
jgi:hypothetical protein